ncbi:DNA-binding XRE family transcriptional regulator [Azomonas agilis]|uniref:DNA-binding XRE family transcriptional regulator n=1 Tax=Azomonas agilis TaxID=116849 RepID=A0A562HZD5_9GAMM|nr:helix-turn-helix domain-containing protein [Azomonas agilis]TWH64137.1 DNA-binding XRE family transcriptional regulator [Azomonas agilis]
MKTFGDRLRTLRETRNWSQEQLGFELGVTKATISKWETGKVQPGLGTLLRIKELFADQSISLDFLGDGQVLYPDLALSPNHRTAESVAPYHTDPAVAQSSDELQLLLLFRTLPKKRQQGLLKLLGA